MEWIVTECVVAAGCQLEVSAALIGEDVLLCSAGRRDGRIWGVWCRRNQGNPFQEMVV